MKGITSFRKIWLFIFLVGLALFLLSSNSDGLRPWGSIESLIVEITAPFQKFTEQTSEIVEDFWKNYFYLLGVGRENKHLKKEIIALKAENIRYRELLATHERLQQLLQFRKDIDHPALACRVIGLDPTGWFKSIIIDKGASDGLHPDMPVVNASGLVGRIVSVSPNFAKVLLIIDHNSAVDCLVQRSRDRGMVKGMSTETCKMDYVVKSSDILIEDVVVTSGLGGIFPKGLAIGHISSVKEVPGELFRDIDITPAVDFSKLEEVLVIIKERKSLTFQKEKKKRK
ncbi:rod shape-determining protein MreC [Thermodesulfobacteriota bacterium]